MNKLIKFLIWTFIVSMTVGFRIFPGKWPISKEDPTIWIKFCDAGITTVENDIIEDDPLAGITNLSFDQVVQSIIDDFNNVPTSFLRLARYPTDPYNPSTPAAGDSPFTIEKSKTRTIEICFGDTDPAAGLSGGHAQAKFENGEIVGCEIKAMKKHAQKAKFLTHLLTHELGHCFGLLHPQESTHAVMSYFNPRVVPRLQNDDQSGLTNRYPEESIYAQESSTFGLSGCSPK